MKSYISFFTKYWISTLVVCVFSMNAQSQDSLSSSVGLFVYPQGGQSEEQQSKDDSECYNWSREQTGYDPVNPSEVEVAAVDSGPDGARARGALRGAAAGAVVDEVREDHIGGGAQVNERYGDDDQAKKTGALLGTARGGSQSRRNRRGQQEQAEQQASAAGDAQMDGFKKAYSACLTGRNYSVQ